MKHCDFFKVKGLVVALLALLAVACTKHEEYEFSGKVLWVRDCTASYLDANAGYVVHLEYPDGVGADIVNEDGDSLKNLIVLYEPTSRVYVADKLHGTFYLDSKYSRSNCHLHYSDYELPEGVFTKTVVD